VVDHLPHEGQCGSVCDGCIGLDLHLLVHLPHKHQHGSALGVLVGLDQHLLASPPMKGTAAVYATCVPACSLVPPRLQTDRQVDDIQLSECRADDTNNNCYQVTATSDNSII
jgi:hypothetical protein